MAVDTIALSCQIVSGDAQNRLPDTPESDSSAARKWVAELSSSLIKTGVMFFLGYLLIQSVELDLKQAQFTADAADKLRDYVVKLNSKDASVSEEMSKATALALGGFGGVAAYPLVEVVEQGDEKQIAWGKLGLEQAGRIAPDETCDVLEAVIDDPTSTYRWLTRKTAVDVAGFVGCATATAPLGRLKAALNDMSELNPLQQKDFRTAIDNAVSRIERATSRKAPWWKIW
jgi:hypothetical protein